ncbi:MAG: hypothetical protein GX220_08805 [Treponema sp.]|nr:hypothetical protein [Treponema sp.]
MSTNEKTNKKGISPKKILISIGSIAILAIAVISFVFLPAMTQRTGNKLPPFGKYNGKAIEYVPDSTMANYMAYYAEQAKEQGRQIDNEYYSLLSNAFNSTVINMAFTDEVKKSGFVPSEKAVDRAMRPYFYDTNGKFSQKIFRDTPNIEKIKLRKNITNNLIYKRYANDYFGDKALQNDETKTGLYGTKTSNKEIDFIRKMNGTQRSFDLISFSTTNYPLSEVAEFVENSKNLFGKYNISIVNFDTESQAKSILKQITNTEITFEDAVKELSIKTYSTDDGKLISNYEYQIINILADEKSIEKINNTNVGEYSEVIAFKNGFGFIRCDSEISTPNTTDEALLNDALSYIKSNEISKIEDYFVNIAKDFSTAALTDGIDKACKEFECEKIEVPPFPINYENNELIGTIPSDIVPQLTGAQYNENFLKTAFSLKKDEYSSPIILGTNVIVIRMNEEIIDDDSSDDTMSFMYPYYSSLFDDSSISTFFLKSKKTVNNVMDVYFNKMLKE